MSDKSNLLLLFRSSTHSVQKMPRPQWTKDQTSRHPSGKTSLYCKGKTGEEEPGNKASLYCKEKTGEEEPGNEASLYCKQQKLCVCVCVGGGWE